jgi:hypothetical protein
MRPHPNLAHQHQRQRQRQRQHQGTRKRTGRAHRRGSPAAPCLCTQVSAVLLVSCCRPLLSLLCGAIHAFLRCICVRCGVMRCTHSTHLSSHASHLGAGGWEKQFVLLKGSCFLFFPPSPSPSPSPPATASATAAATACPSSPHGGGGRIGGIILPDARTVLTAEKGTEDGDRSRLRSPAGGTTRYTRYKWYKRGYHSHVRSWSYSACVDG